MPVTTVKLSLLGTERELRVSMSTLHAIREQTGLRMVSPADILSNLSGFTEDVLAVVIYEALVDKGEIQSAQWLCERIAPADIDGLLDRVALALLGDVRYKRLEEALAASQKAEVEKNGKGLAIPAQNPTLKPPRKRLNSKISGPSPLSTSA